MKRKLLWAAGGLLALLVVGYLSVTLVLGSVVKQAVERYGPSYTQTAVGLKGANLSPFSGSGTLSGLTVANPAGWSKGQALALGKIHVEVAPMSLFSDHVVVNEIRIEDPQFLYETRVVASNIGDLMKAIDKAAASPAAAPQATTHSGQTMRFEVRHFRLTGGKVTVGIGPSAVTIPLLPITLDNVGSSQGGITSSQLSAAVLRSVMPSIVTAAAGAAGKFVPASATDAVKSVGGRLGSFLSGKK